jgi:SNF family Na+-dependent transporter
VDLWVEAASQIFFSLSPAWGVLITFGSYLPQKEPVLQDAVIIALVNSATSIFAGFVVFSVLGHMSETTGVPIEDVAVGGPSLAFIVFPEALTTLPAPYFFAVLFFLMLVLLGIDSAFANVELIVASLQESKLVGAYHKRVGLCAFLFS